MPQKLTKSVVLEEAKKLARERNFDLKVLDAVHTKDPSGTSKWELILECKHGHRTKSRRTYWKQKRNKGKCSKCEGRDLDEEERISILRKVHRDKYNYKNFKYKGSKNKISVICPEHGEFKIEYTGHITGNGCQKCAGNITKTGQEILNLVNNSPFYEIINVDPTKKYKTNDKLEIKCNLFEHHPIQKRSLNKIISRGCSCKYCGEKTSSYELFCYSFLYEREIDFSVEEHIVYPDGTHGYFDIFIDGNKKTAIEIDGEFHYEENRMRKDGLSNLKALDKKKDKYCLDNNINLIRIPFHDIERKLNDLFQNHKIKREIEPANIENFKKLLPESKALQIHELKTQGLTNSQISNKLNVIPTYVSKVLHGKIYKKIFMHLYPNSKNPHITPGVKHFTVSEKEKNWVSSELIKGETQASIVRKFKIIFGKTISRGWIHKFVKKHDLRTEKVYKVELPNGQFKYINNLADFCRANNIKYLNLYKTLIHKGRKHKGYSIQSMEVKNVYKE